MVFVVASHYQSLRIIVLLLQTCLLGSEALSRTLLLQQLHRLQQDRPAVSTLRESLPLFLEDRRCCKFLKGNSRDVFSIPFPLKRRFGELLVF